MCMVRELQFEKFVTFSYEWLNKEWVFAPYQIKQSEVSNDMFLTLSFCFIKVTVDVEMCLSASSTITLCRNITHQCKIS